MATTNPNMLVDAQRIADLMAAISPHLPQGSDIAAQCQVLRDEAADLTSTELLVGGHTHRHGEAAFILRVDKGTEHKTVPELLEAWDDKRFEFSNEHAGDSGWVNEIEVIDVSRTPAPEEEPELAPSGG